MPSNPVPAHVDGRSLALRRWRSAYMVEEVRICDLLGAALRTRMQNDITHRGRIICFLLLQVRVSAHVCRQIRKLQGRRWQLLVPVELLCFLLTAQAGFLGGHLPLKSNVCLVGALFNLPRLFCLDTALADNRHGLGTLGLKYFCKASALDSELKFSRKSHLAWP